MATVLKEFMWARNGYTIETLKPGDERDFGNAFAGLAAEGYVSVEPAQQKQAEPDPAPEVTAAVDPVAEPAVEPAIAVADVAPAVVAEPAPRRRNPR